MVKLYFVFVILLYLSPGNASTSDDDSWKLSVNQRFAALENKVHVLQQQLDITLSENKQLKNDNSALKHDVKILEDRVRDLIKQDIYQENQLNQKDIELGIFKKRFDRSAKQLRQNAIELGIFKKRLDRFVSLNNQNRNGDFPEEKRDIKVPNEGQVRLIVPSVDDIAFYCYMSTGVSTIQNNHILTYDVVPTNKGHAYNKDDGIFTAPTSGVYVFSWTTVVGPNSCVFTNLMINGQILGSTHPDTTSNAYDGPTGIVVVEADVGQHVFVRIPSSCHGSVISDVYSKTSFAGWLL